MDLRGIANAVSSTVNPNSPVRVQRSDGYTIGAGRRQVPAYTSVDGFGQVQALDGKDLQQLDGLNIQGTVRAVYLRGALAGVIRPDSKGGDLVQTLDSDGNVLQTWLVVKVLESWPTWTKAAIVLQGGA